MKIPLLDSWKRGVASGIAFFLTVSVLSVAATYITIDSTDYAASKPLTSSLMTKIMGNIEDINTRLAAIPTGIGNGQTWQNVGGSRTSGTTYTNSTGKPIFVSVNVIMNTPGSSLYVNGVLVGYFNLINGGWYGQLSAIVPSGWTYVLDSSVIISWSELR